MAAVAAVLVGCSPRELPQMPQYSGVMIDIENPDALITQVGIGECTGIGHAKDIVRPVVSEEIGIDAARHGSIEIVKFSVRGKMRQTIGHSPFSVNAEISAVYKDPDLGLRIEADGFATVSRGDCSLQMYAANVEAISTSAREMAKRIRDQIKSGVMK